MLKSLRVHGQGSDKYDNVRIGMNAGSTRCRPRSCWKSSRSSPTRSGARQIVAARYNEALANVRRYPTVPNGLRYRCGRNTRFALPAAATATSRGPAQGGRRADGDLLRQAAAPADRLSPFPSGRLAGGIAAPPGEVLSLPMHPYLEGATQEMIVKAIVDAI